MLFLEGSQTDGEKRNEERPRLDFLMSLLGFVWLFAFGFPALGGALSEGSFGFVPSLVVGGGPIAILVAAATRGGVPEVRQSWRWLQAAVAAQAANCIFAPMIDGTALAETASTPQVAGTLRLGALLCLGMAASQPAPGTKYWQPLKPWRATPLSPWIFGAGTGLLGATHLLVDTSDGYSPLLLTFASVAYLTFTPWRMHLERRRAVERSTALVQKAVRLRNLLDNITGRGRDRGSARKNRIR